jgi:hypothetical protein
MSEENSNGVLDRLGDESRRDFMKKGAVVAGGLALGAASAGTAAAQNQVSNALFFADGIVPGATFTVVGQLPTQVTTDILSGEIKPGLDGIDNADDYNGYSISYLYSDVPQMAYLFVRQDVVGGTFFPPTGNQSVRVGTDPSYFSSDLNLVQASLQQVGGNNQ